MPYFSWYCVLAVVWVACSEEPQSTGAGGASAGGSDTGGTGGTGGSETGGDDMCPAAPNCTSLQTPADSDGDGCADRCCFASCEMDFVLVDYNDDGCNDACADKPCNTTTDCAVYNCAFFAMTCDAPVGVCSNFACDMGDEVCGCDGVTYANECEAHAAGTGVDLPGACP